MTIRLITHAEKNAFNFIVAHPLQSYEWGEFREKTGVKVIRGGFFEKEKIVDGFQMTIHKIPHTPWTIGYLPRGGIPNREIIEELQQIGREERCVFIQLEPYIEKEAQPVILEGSAQRRRPIGSQKDSIAALRLLQNDKIKFIPSTKPFFHKYTFIIDLTKSEEELLKNMHPKTRYNIKVAQKHGVEVIEDNSDKAFEEYIRLTKETTQRQKFYAHSENYHRAQWKILKSTNGESMEHNNLTSHLLLAKYRKITLAAWILFTFKDTLYYPYGASSNEHKETMASNLMMWEAIRSGKKLGLKKFDLWGCLGPNPDPNDPWYGFHRFKEGYGGELVEFIGSYDLVINPALYQIYKIVNKMRWGMLKLQKRKAKSEKVKATA